MYLAHCTVSQSVGLVEGEEAMPVSVDQHSFCSFLFANLDSAAIDRPLISRIVKSIKKRIVVVKLQIVFSKQGSYVISYTFEDIFHTRINILL
jgi:hypothetical protein